jgi:hypothetical protein
MICSACDQYIRNGQRYEERDFERQSVAAVTIVLHTDPADCPALASLATPPSS